MLLSLSLSLEIEFKLLATNFVGYMNIFPLAKESRSGEDNRIYDNRKAGLFVLGTAIVWKLKVSFESEKAIDDRLEKSCLLLSELPPFFSRWYLQRKIGQNLDFRMRRHTSTSSLI